MDYRDEFLKGCIPLDTETTSLDFKIAEVIELGYTIKLNDGKWHIVNNLYKPAEMEVTPEVSAVTHITPKMVASSNFFSERLEEDLNVILDTIAGHGNIVAHNAFYDSRVLEKYNIRDNETPWLCTMRMAKKLFSGDDTVTQFNLPYLRYRFELDIPEDMPHHRAGTDAYMTAILLERLVKELEDRKLIDVDRPYREQIETWLETPIIMSKINFGKHKGTPYTELPMSYLSWMIKNMESLDETQDEYDADLAATVAHAVEKHLT